MVQRPEEEASFINVDLDIEAPYDLEPLVRALGEQVTDLHTGPVDGRFQSHLEIALREDMPSDADTTIQEFVRLLYAVNSRTWNGNNAAEPSLKTADLPRVNAITFGRQRGAQR